MESTNPKQALPLALIWVLSSFSISIATCFLSNKLYGQSMEGFCIGQETLTFYCTARQREVKTEIWYPSSESGPRENDGSKSVFYLPNTCRGADIAAGKFPLILLSHGTGGGRLTMEWFASGLAQEGFMVAAVDHWGNTYDNIVPEYFLRVWERPLDISWALTNLLGHQKFATAIDGEKIGAAGFSLGGHTVISLAGASYDQQAVFTYGQTPEGKKEMDIPELPGLSEMLQDTAMRNKLESSYAECGHSLADNRIGAVMAMAPAIGQGFPTKENFDKMKVPVCIIGLENDQIAPVKTNASHYHQLIAHSEYHLWEGDAGHFVFLNAAQSFIQEENPIFFKDPPSVDRQEIHRKTISLAKQFFEREF